MTRLLGFVVHNWPLKVAAIVLATLLYGVFVLNRDSRAMSGSVPIEPRGQQAGIVIVSNLGDAGSIRYISSNAGVRPETSCFQAYVDFRGVSARSGQVVLPVTVEC